MKNDSSSRFLAGRAARFVLAAAILLAAAGASRASEPVSRFADMDGHRIHYKDLGKGSEALVFIHGWTCDSEFWRAQWPAFDGRMRVVMVDLLGHGLSDKPRTTYTMDDFARSVDAVLRHAGVERAVLVGHSMGTPVARQFYRRHPGRTRAIVIVDGALRPFADKAMAEQVLAALRGPSYQQMTGPMIDMLSKGMAADRAAWVKAKMAATPQHVALGAFEGMLAEEIWKEDPIEVPTLAIMAKEAGWPADTESYYRRLVPRLEYHAWEGVSHFLMIDRPEAFNRTLADFLVKNGLMKR